jgi:hypothetical protein
MSSDKHGETEMAQPPQTESWTGPYGYLELTFQEQNKVLAINNPLKPGYVPAARYLISTLGNVSLWRKPTGEC